MRRFVLAIAVLLCAVSMPARRAVAREIYLEVDTMAGPPEAPVDALANALHRDKKSTRFRLSWGVQASNLRAGADAVYDRRRHTLIFYSTGTQLVDEKGRWQRERQHILYRGVTDRILFRLAARHRDDYSVLLDGHFDELPDYGCSKKWLRHEFSWAH